MKGVGQRRVLRRGATEAHDQVAVEEPLEIRLAGERVAVAGDDARVMTHDSSKGFVMSKPAYDITKLIPPSVWHCRTSASTGSAR